MPNSLQLPPSALKLHIDLADFKALPESTKLTSNILGQSRAQAALEFGIAMNTSGYNIFVMGEPGLGRLTMITQHLETLANKKQPPPSFAYVENFENPREPIAISLPTGQGQNLNRDIEKLLDNLLATFPAAFESPSYQQKKSAIERQFSQLFNAAIDLVEKNSRALNIALFREGESITFAPLRKNKPLDEDQFSQMPQPEREAFHKHVEALEDYLGEVLLEMPQWRRTMVEKIRQLDNDTISLAVDPLFSDLNETYQHVDDALIYLTKIRKNLQQTITDYLMPGRTTELNENTLRRMLLEQYLPNILVDLPTDAGAPVIFEPHPIYQNLFGRIEYVSEQGTLITNYRRICSGSLHRANGGYLIIDAEKLLTFPFVWDALKRALQSGRIEIESPYAELGINPITLKPQVIPLNVKVILVGPRDIYYLLEEMDSEFNEMFKILADFDNYIPRTHDSMQQFALLMQKHAEETATPPLTNAAIQCLIEHSCRLSENQHHFSARVNDSLDIIAEANLFCQQQQAKELDRTHVEQALSAREFRNGRLSQTILEEMLDGTILIDTDGEAIGKINGLTVLEVGGSSFGAPARITASVYPGSRGIVDVEREVELGQPIHSKGVMILSGYLGHCYAQQFPLAISASIAIEQSYGYIDGDSASLAELCCLISALTRIPIKQSVAITGSINQYGEVQAIGGVNEKIEGYFRLCQARGLNGQHAVIIPAANKRNLMLKQEVINAVVTGLFTIYAVATVDETLELLTGQIAGVADEQGNYPDGTINFRAISRLKEISEMAAEDDKEEEGGS